MENLGLKPEISAHLDLDLFREDTTEDLKQTLGPLYHQMRIQIPHLNAAYEQAKGIDPEVPPARRRERQREIILKAIAEFESSLVEPLADFSLKLHSQEQKILESSGPAPPKSQTDAIIREMRAQEIRKAISEAKKGDAVQMVMAAARDGNRTVLDAVEKSAFPILPREILEQATAAYHEIHNPTLGKTREANEEIMAIANEKPARIVRAMKRAFNIALADEMRRENNV